MKLGLTLKSDHAPRSMEEAIKKFFTNSKQSDLSSFRRKQAESIQIIAHGPKLNTSLVIYDDGEGQHPDAFEDTLLSLLRGNKNEIHFVQGKSTWVGVEQSFFAENIDTNWLLQKGMMALDHLVLH